MELDTRVGLLVSSGTISEDVAATVRKTIQRMEYHWNISLTEENGSRLITHLAMALMRLSKDKKIEVIEVMENEHFTEIKKRAAFPKAREIASDLIVHTGMDIPQIERDYLELNVCLVLEDA